MNDYNSFLTSRFAVQWKKVGPVRRAGVLVPLFSLYSQKSIGVGEFPDLEKFADWCAEAGLSMIQLLPLNDVGYNFRPYDSHSSFALEPMHLSLERLAFAPLGKFALELEKLRSEFPVQPPYFDTRIKGRKLELLWRIYQEREAKGSALFDRFCADNDYWLDDYALFKVLKQKFLEKGWEEWPEVFRQRQIDALDAFETENLDAVRYHKWIQWQAARQMEEAHAYARKKNLFLVGDLPFLVSRDSADVWAHPAYFKLDRLSGAPPDLCFAGGQVWGMPPYRWDAVAADGYEYVLQKLHTAARFYDLFRIDHFVGVFRVWTFQAGLPADQTFSTGAFDPPDETLWEEQGQNLVRVMETEKRLLPCAEDLGTVPVCSAKVLLEAGIPGMEIPRWSREWGKSYDFLPPVRYRKNSIVVLSTHDMSGFVEWWEKEAGTVEEEVLKVKCAAARLNFEEVRRLFFDKGPVPGRLVWKREVTGADVVASKLARPERELSDLVDLYRSTSDEKQKLWRSLGLEGMADEKASVRLIEKALENAGKSSSIFSIQLLEDWLSLDPAIRWGGRINFPGTVRDTNWRLLAPFPLEKLKRLAVTHAIRDINHRTGRK